MSKITKLKIEKMRSKKFSFDQLSQISDENYGVLNRCIDMTGLEKDIDYISIPRLVHHHAFGEPVAPHIRTLVVHPKTGKWLAYQDMTIDQWNRGSIIKF